MKACVNGLEETKAEDGSTARLQSELASLSHAVGRKQGRSVVQVTLHAAPHLLSATKLA
jgi:hypothetical protein